MMDNKKTVKNNQTVSDINRIKRIINRIAKEKDGQEFFNFLMQICGFGISSLVMDLSTNEINTNSSLYNEARKTVYYEVRRLIDKEYLMEIEYMKLKKEEIHDS